MSGSITYRISEGRKEPLYRITIDYRPKEVKTGQQVEIYGYVYKDNTPMAGVKVELYINGEKKGETRTDANGMYRFVVKFNRPGAYRVYTVAYITFKEEKEGVKISVPVVVAAALAGISAVAGIAAGVKRKK